MRDTYYVDLSGELRNKILEKAGLYKNNKLYINSIEQETMEDALGVETVKIIGSKVSILEGKDIEPLSAVISLGDQESLASLSTINFKLPSKKLKNGDISASIGIAYIGDRNPEFKNLENITFKADNNIFSTDEIKKALNLAEMPEKVLTSSYTNGDISVYEVKVYIQSKEAVYEGYFVKTKKGFYKLKDFDSTERSYYDPLSYIYYIETKNKKIIGVGTTDSFETPQIFFIDESGEVEFIQVKSHETC